MNNRDMFYQNLNQGYAQNPGFMQPSGYNLNSQYASFGPNIGNNVVNDNYYDEIEKRFDKINRQIKSLDTRLQKLESIDNEITNDNIYMI